MDIHEYQAKEILARFGVPVPRGGLAYSPEQAAYRAREIGGERWVVKAQIHSGGRGKAGGVKLCRDEHEVEAAADELLGKRLVTEQTGPRGKVRLPALCRGRGRHGSASSIWASCSTARSRAGDGRRLLGRRHGDRGDRRTTSPRSLIRAVGRAGGRHAGASRRARSPSRWASSRRRSQQAVDDHPRLLPGVSRARRHHGRDQPADRHRGRARCWRSTPR